MERPACLLVNQPCNKMLVPFLSFLSLSRLVESTPQRLYCQTCDETYPLPQRGKITTYNDQRCPLDNFEVNKRLGTFRLSF